MSTLRVHSLPQITARARWASLLFALLAAAHAGAGGVATSTLVVQAPPEMAQLAAEIGRLAPAALAPALQLTGLAEPGAPIVVVLAPESSAAARATSRWISGFANGAAGLVVLLPERVDRYPDRSLDSLLRHELTHVLIARAARGGSLPRWFDEGLAMAAGRDWELGDRARVALAVLGDGRLPLARIDQAFAGGESEVQTAYALAGDVVRTLLQQQGDATGARILARVARGERFGNAFHAVTGQTLGAFEADYWERRTLWDRWVPVVSSSVLLWGGISLLAVAAFRRRRQRDAERMRRWSEEEPPEEELQ